MVDRTRPTRLPALGAVPNDGTPEQKRFFNAVKELLEVLTSKRGDPLDSAVTFRDLVVGSNGLESITVPGAAEPVPVGSGGVDPGPPPAPENAEASPGLGNIFLEWTLPETYLSSRTHAFTEIYAADRPLGDPAPTFDDAVFIGSAPGQFYVDPVGPNGKTRHYWLRTVKNTGDSTAPIAYSEWIGGTNGLHATSGVTPQVILADQLFLANALGQDYLSQPYVFLSEPTTVNGITAPAGLYINAAMIQSGTIVDAMIGNLSADKVLFGTMSGDRITVGSLSADRIKTGTLEATTQVRIGGRMILDGAGWLESYSVDGYSRNGDYVRLDSGNFKIYRYVPALGSTVLYNFLSRMETGVGANNVEVTLPGYWKSQPRIIVTPATLALYDPTYANQAQAIDCRAENIVETAPGSMQYKFMPVARLQLAANSGQTAINLGSGVTSSNTYTSGSYTTPANCTSITPNVTLTSNRGTGSSQYYRRKVQWLVQYWNGSAWVDDPAGYRTKAIGDTTGSVIDSYTFSFPSAAAWTWRLQFVASDVDGSVFGAMQYTYTQETVYAAADPDTDGLNITDSGGATISGTNYNTLGSPSLPGEIYQITYSATVSASVSSYDTDRFLKARASCEGFTWLWDETSYNQQWSLYQGGTYNESGHTVIGGALISHTSAEIQRAISKTVSGAGLTFNPNGLAAAMVGGYNASGLTVWSAGLYTTFSAGQAVVYHRTPVPNSTTPSNNFYLNSYNYDLTAAQVLATGSLNYTALGE